MGNGTVLCDVFVQHTSKEYTQVCKPEGREQFADKWHSTGSCLRLRKLCSKVVQALLTHLSYFRRRALIRGWIGHKICIDTTSIVSSSRIVNLKVLNILSGLPAWVFVRGCCTPRSIEYPTTVQTWHLSTLSIVYEAYCACDTPFGFQTYFQSKQTNSKSKNPTIVIARIQGSYLCRYHIHLTYKIIYSRCREAMQFWWESAPKSLSGRILYGPRSVGWRIT